MDESEKTIKPEWMMAIPKKVPVVAIDGPAGTGKSSTTKRLAEVLHFVHVDTGAIYRAIAYLCIQMRILRPEILGGRNSTALAPLDAQWTPAAIEVARTLHLEFRRLKDRNPSNRVFANGSDVTELIRTPEVSLAASLISAIPEVRMALLSLQRKFGCQAPSILEGRDIGTVIFPDADVKFFLTASVEERAKRRLAELDAQGGNLPSFEELKRQIEMRDRGDSTRNIAPLKKADDAIEVDTTTLTLDQVVEKLEGIVRAKLGGRLS